MEILVQFEIDVRYLPARYHLLKLYAPDDLAIEETSLQEVPVDWVDRTDVTRAMGDRWLALNRSPLLTVPSAVVPETHNVLLNPAHREAKRVVVVKVSEHVIDPRLLK